MPKVKISSISGLSIIYGDELPAPKWAMKVDERWQNALSVPDYVVALYNTRCRFIRINMLVHVG